MADTVTSQNIDLSSWGTLISFKVFFFYLSAYHHWSRQDSFQGGKQKLFLETYV
jgi:hypothetical protein